MHKNRLLPDPITAWDYYSDLDRDTTNELIIDDYGAFVDFIKQPLALSMFIPCKDGKPLEKPKDYDYWKIRTESHSGADCWEEKYYNECKEYQEAEARCIFEGFEKVGEWLKSGQRAISYVDGKFKFRGQTIKSIHDLCNKVRLTEAKFKELRL